MKITDLTVLFAAVQQLSAITRYSKDSTTKRESVLEHTGFVSLFCYFIGYKVNGFEEVDFHHLMRRAAVHDVDEIIVGDIPRVTKYATAETAETFAKMERDAIVRLSQITGIDMWSDWSNSKAEDVEGYILRVVDTLAVVYKTWQEIELFGNNTFSRIAWELHDDVLPKLYRKVAEATCMTEMTTTYLLSVIDVCQDIVVGLQNKCEQLSPAASRTLISFNVVGG